MRLINIVGAAAALFGAVYAENGYFDPPVYPRECARVSEPSVDMAFLGQICASRTTNTI